MSNIGLIAVVLALTLLNGQAQAATDDAALGARVDRVLAKTPLIDGHNDLPAIIRQRYASKLEGLDLAHDTSKLQGNQALIKTDIPRLRAGRVGGQFWSVFVSAAVTGPEVVQETIEQIDLVKRMAERYPHDFEMAYTADDVVRIHNSGRIACLIGIEGGHQINASLGVLRQMYALGARYMTLTHSENNPWADSATDNPAHHGLTPFGKAVVAEMNRVGMLVDLSHVSTDTMRSALAIAKAPVIFSHSGARAVDDHPRDVPDDVLKLVAANRGVVMATFFSDYVSHARAVWVADQAAERARFNSPPYGGLYIGQPDRAKAAMGEWLKSHPAPLATLAEVADHIEHIRDVAGIDSVGIGSDFDGSANTAAGLDGVDKFRALLVELARRGWTDDDLAKVAGANILRVMREAEQTAKRLQATEAASAMTLTDLDGIQPQAGKTAD